MMNSTFAERFKLLRSFAELTQVQMSRLVGLSRSYWSCVECNAYEPTTDHLVKVKNALDVPFDWLLEGKGEVPTREHIQLRINDLKISSGITL